MGSKIYKECGSNSYSYQFISAANQANEDDSSDQRSSCVCDENIYDSGYI